MTVGWRCNPNARRAAGLRKVFCHGQEEKSQAQPLASAQPTSQHRSTQSPDQQRREPQAQSLASAQPP